MHSPRIHADPIRGEHTQSPDVGSAASSQPCTRLVSGNGAATPSAQQLYPWKNCRGQLGPNPEVGWAAAVANELSPKKHQTNHSA